MNNELYQEIILAHYRQPKAKAALDEDQQVFEIRNPLCGDIIRLQCRLEGDRVLKWTHDSQGCAASVASCSIMCEQLNGCSIGEATRKVKDFIAAMESEDSSHSGDVVEREALRLFRHNDARKQCVLLAWNCAEKALAAVRGTK